MRLIVRASIVAALMMPGLGTAAPLFDAETPVLCTVAQLYECDSSIGCELVPPQTAEDIRHLTFNFEQKTLRLEHWDPGLTSAIHRSEVVDDNLVVQGTDAGRVGQVDGAGWSMSLNRSYGTMVMTVSGRDVAFVGTGSCIPAAE